MAFTALPTEGDHLLTIASLGCSIAEITFSSTRTLKGHATSLRGQFTDPEKEAPNLCGGMQVEAIIYITAVEAPARASGSCGKSRHIAARVAELSTNLPI
jgi:hypothetical protein